MRYRVQPTISSLQPQSNAARAASFRRHRVGPGVRWSKPVLGGLLCFMALHCDKARDTRLRDTEDRRFVLTCEKGVECQLADASASAESGVAFQLKQNGRLQAVCMVSVADKAPQASDCRALVCEADEDCPPDPGLTTGHCINELCVDPAQALGPEDAVMLCLAGTGLGRKRPEQVERYAMALNCGEPCQIPRPCRQP